MFGHISLLSMISKQEVELLLYQVDI